MSSEKGGGMSLSPPGERGLPPHPLTKHTFQGRLMGELRSVYCTGCGYVSIFSSINRVFQEDGLEKEKFPFVVGIGCYSSSPIYLPAPAIMVLHGRVPAVCTGVKLANPGLKPVGISGDGDSLAIGASHLIHAARRNLDMVLVLLHNNTYGMTGGQVAPVTPTGYKATTAPYGQVETPFDAVQLVSAAGATFAARWDILHTQQLEMSFRKALSHKGFALIEVLSPCPTYFGRNNAMAEPLDNLRWIADNTVMLEEAQKQPPEAIAGKYVLGEFYQVQRPELSEVYGRLRERAGPPAQPRSESERGGRGAGGGSRPDLAKGEKEEASGEP